MRYLSDRTPVLFFPSFTRHQTGMRYERETPSRFAPPPGYRRSSEGLVQPDSDANLIAQPSESGSQTRLRQTPAVSADKVRSDSGSTPAEVKDQVEVEVEVQGKDQGKSKDKDNHHHHQETSRAARSNDDDDIVTFSSGEPELERIAQLPLSTLRVAAMNHLKHLPAWIGSRQFIVRSDSVRLASLLSWLRLYQILGQKYVHDPRAIDYQSNPFTGVENPVGRIITQARERNLAPLLPHDLAELRAEMEEVAAGSSISYKQND